MQPTPLLEQLETAALSPGARSLRAQKAADVIRRRRAYRWVGIYELDHESPALLAWSGFGMHPQSLPGGDEGPCRTALRTRATVMAGSRSRILVPIVEGGTVIGIIDVESDPLPALGSDRALLEGCACVLASLWSDAPDQ